MLVTIIVFYLVCMFVYISGNFFSDPKANKARFFRRLLIAIAVMAVAFLILFTFVNLF